MVAMEVVLSSTVESVAVFARGALVTRLAAVGDLADGAVDVVIPDVTIAALPGSVRVRAEGSTRRVVSVHTALDLPETRPPDAPSDARVLELDAEKRRLRAFRDLLVARRDDLVTLTIAPEIVLSPQREVPLDALRTRVSGALRMADLVGRLAASLDRRIAELTERLRVNERAFEAAALALHAAGAKERDVGRPTRACRIRLVGSGPVAALRLTYAVEAAAWFPTHTIRFEAGGRSGEWTVEGLVVQATLEDWEGVRLSLSTADLGFDARLPELASLRFGRAQRKKARAFRPLPNDLDRLFEGHDRAFAGELDEEDEEEEVIKTVAHAALSDGPSFDDAVTVAVRSGLPASERARSEGAFGRVAEIDEDLTPADTRFSDADLEMARSLTAMPAPAAAQAVGAAKSRFGFGGGIPGARRRGVTPTTSRPEVLLSTEPDDAWLDFDRLTLSGPDRGRRGRLVLAPRESGGAGAGVAKVSQAVEWDLLAKRGMFDHRYDALASASVPADGHLARVPVAKGAFSATFEFRSVPSASMDVYREAVFENPFAFPVLGGPAQIFVEGNLVASSELEPTDRGGTVRVGTGVEERFKIARNVRVTEETAGLLGGSLAVRHDVSIEVSSTMGFDADVHVFERIPVTEDKAVEIEVLAMRPEAERYDQASRGHPVKGGRRFVLRVPSGGRQSCELSYELGFSSKLEIAGGNRRA